MKFESIITFFTLIAATNAAIRGTTSNRRHRDNERSALSSTKSRYLDVANDIDESSLTKIKQRYLMTSIDINPETGLFDPLITDVNGKEDKGEDAPDPVSTNGPDMSTEMSMSMSMEMSMSTEMSMSM